MRIGTFFFKIMEITKTDFNKMMLYLGDAANFYDALPVQKCKCRAHMIRKLIAKLKSKQPCK